MKGKKKKKRKNNLAQLCMKFCSGKKKFLKNKV